jgi:hypothetical protein
LREWYVQIQRGYAAVMLAVCEVLSRCVFSSRSLLLSSDFVSVAIFRHFFAFHAIFRLACWAGGRCALPDVCDCVTWFSALRDGQGRPQYRKPNGDSQNTGWTGYVSRSMCFETRVTTCCLCGRIVALTNTHLSTFTVHTRAHTQRQACAPASEGCAHPLIQTSLPATSQLFPTFLARALFASL